jgi:hypothetical protein
MRQPGEQRPEHSTRGDAYGDTDPDRPAIEEIDTGSVPRTSRLGRAFGFDGQVGLDVPVDRVPDPSKRRRERAVALTGLVAVVALVGVAVVGRDRVASLSGEGEPTAVAAAPSDTPRPTRTRRPRTAAPALPPPSAISLPTLPNDVLRGAPTPVFLGREGKDVQILAWEPGSDALAPAITIPGAFDGLSAYSEGLLTRRSAVLITGAKRGNEGEARVVGLDGSVRWAAEFPTAEFSGWTWSDDERLAAVATIDGTLSLLRLGDHAVDETRFELDLRPEPRPSPSKFDLRVEPTYTELVGFTDDNRWLYVQQHSSDGEPYPARIATRTGDVERLDELPDEVIRGLDQFGSRANRVDPVTHRRIELPTSNFRPTSELRVVEEDGSPAFTLDLEMLLGWAWAGDGSLVVLTGDGTFPGATGTRLNQVDERGGLGPPLLDVDGPVYAHLVGARDGHVMLLFASDGYGVGMLLAMVRIEDGATASLELSFEEVDGMQAWSSAWLEDLER